MIRCARNRTDYFPARDEKTKVRLWTFRQLLFLKSCPGYLHAQGWTMHQPDNIEKNFFNFPCIFLNIIEGKDVRYINSHFVVRTWISPICYLYNFFSFILLIHEGSHREVYQDFQPSYDIFCSWCQGLFRP